MKQHHRVSFAGLVLFALAVLAPTDLLQRSNSCVFAQATTAPPQQALIVMRHAQDVDDTTPTSCVATVGKLTPTWQGLGWKQSKITYKDGNGRDYDVSAMEIAALWNKQTSEYHTTTPPKRTEESSVKMRQHCLNGEGETQATRLRDKLPGILSSYGYAPVKRVITINPISSKDSYPTANPFNTVLPFMLANPDFKAANAGNPASLLLLDGSNVYSPGEQYAGISKELQAMFEPEKVGTRMFLPNGGGSTILCWEGGQLCDNLPADSAATSPISVLRRLQGAAISEEAPPIGEPDPYNKNKPRRIAKGTTLYVFTLRPGTGLDGPADNKKQDYDLAIFYWSATKNDFELTETYKVTGTGENQIVEKVKLR